MGNIIELKPLKQDRKVRAIEFMESVIEELKADNLDPKHILIFMKWANQVDEKGNSINEQFHYWDNIKYTENLLGCVKLLEDKILSDTVR